MASIGAAAGGSADRIRPALSAALIWSLVVAAMVILALANPVNRDEGAFTGPAAVAATARPYIDFLYLQTPLQALVSGPFARLFPGWSFIAMRTAVALMGAGILALVYLAQRGLGVERRAAAVCAALLASCYSFQFGCAVVRNDALPALLALGGLQLGLLALRGRIVPALAWGAAGLLMGAATSAKLSYAFPAAGAGLFLAGQALFRRVPVGAVAAFAAGAAAGLSPCLIAWTQAPDAFVFSTLKFNAQTLIQWYRDNHMAWKVSPAANVLGTLGILMVGPALGALALVAGATARGGWAELRERPRTLFLDVMILAGLVAALAPTPSNFQYALPVLPALFIRLGLESGRWRAIRFAPLAAGLGAIGLIAGCGYGAAVAWRGLTSHGGWPAANVTRQAHWIGARLKAAKAAGFVSTLSPQVVLDSAYPLDPRFSTGVFVYRSGGQISGADLARYNSVGPQTLDSALDQRPPAAIVVGEGGRLDDALRRYARAHGYRREVSPFGRLELDISPT